MASYAKDGDDAMMHRHEPELSSHASLRARLRPGRRFAIAHRSATPRADARPAAAVRSGATNPLSPREQQILAQVAGGDSNKQIARLLGVGERTVKAHVTGVMNKLGAFNRAHAAVLALQGGFLRASPPCAGGRSRSQPVGI
jgi:DNA-binding NarL/FixJ family response regulator